MRTFLLSCAFILSFTFTGTAGDRDSVLEARIDKALEKALFWLVEDPDHFRPETYILYNFLERKFGAPPACNHEEYMEKAKENERRYNKIYPFLRFVEPNLTMSQERINSMPNAMDKVLVRSVWCDQFELPDDLLLDFRDHLDIGGYYMTHVYLGMMYLHEQQHPICETKEFKVLEERALASLKKYIDDHPDAEDITIEALCFLAYSDNWEGYVTKKNIEKVLDAQLDSGAWYYGKFKEFEEQHTVILAMWLLYEYRYPNAANTPWLPVDQFPKKIEKSN